MYIVAKATKSTFFLKSVKFDCITPLNHFPSTLGANNNNSNNNCLTLSDPGYFRLPQLKFHDFEKKHEKLFYCFILIFDMFTFMSK